MGFRNFAWTVLGGLAGLTVLVSSASAQTCAADSDCPKGFDCEVTAVSGCAVPTPQPEPAGTRRDCGDGGACAADAGTPSQIIQPCETKEYRSCVPGDCMADTDCAGGMVCHERRSGTCSSAPTPACAPGYKCPDFAPPMCTETVEHVCIPRYVLPCQKAADCGEGFTCEAQEMCGCAGSAGSAGAPAPSTPASGPTPTPAADAGIDNFRAPSPPASKPLPPPDCKCEPTPEKYCKVIERACRADSECPASLFCQRSAPATNPATPAIECDVPAGQGDAGVCAADRALPAQPPPANPYHCVPRYDFVDPDYGGPHGGGTAGTGAPTPTSAPMPGQPGTNPTTTPPTVPGHAADAGVAVGESGEEAAGPRHVQACSVAAPGSAGANGLGLGAAGLLALGWVFARRRRSR